MWFRFFLTEFYGSWGKVVVFFSHPLDFWKGRSLTVNFLYKIMGVIWNIPFEEFTGMCLIVPISKWAGWILEATIARKHPYFHPNKIPNITSTWNACVCVCVCVCVCESPSVPKSIFVVSDFLHVQFLYKQGTGAPWLVSCQRRH